MGEKMNATIPVFMFLVDADDRVYLQRRFNTGYLDGHFEPPAGKVDEEEFPQEAACREALEEAGVTVKPDDIELFHTYMNLSGGNPWLGLMFRTRVWDGIPNIQEPDKCDVSGFYHLDDLPKLTPQVEDGIIRLLGTPAIQLTNYDSIDSKKF